MDREIDALSDEICAAFVQIGAAIRAGEPTTCLLDQLDDGSRLDVSVRILLCSAMRSLPTPHIETIEWLWRRGHEKEIVVSAYIFNPRPILQWLITKKPDITSWDYCGIWSASRTRRASGPANIFAWFLEHASRETLQRVAQREFIGFLDYHDIGSMLALGPCFELETTILKDIIANRSWAFLPLFTDKSRAVRAVLLADGGRALHGRRKVPKCLLRFLTRSDRASVGLPCA
jgi:hypothetical protein